MASGLIAALTVVLSAPNDLPVLYPDTPAFGVVVHNAYRDGLEEAGVSWVRLNVRWKNVEKMTRGNYDWESTDKLLGYYLERGFRVMGLLTMERLCPLYEADKQDEGLVLDAIARWCGAAAARYKGKGILWELGNEPEVFPMGDYWNDPKTYTRMARKAASAIKTADPGAEVAALSTAWFDRGFISQALEEGLLADGTVDVLTYHGYHRRGMAPESGLAEDVAWLREQIQAYAPPGKTVIVADSERGYCIVPFLTPKHWGSWRNVLYSERAQAAYLARHYLETIHLGVEIAVWYKDMNCGEGFSLYRRFGDGELRPMGHVYRNLAALLPENPKHMRNTKYTVSLTDPTDAVPAPDGLVNVRTFLRSYLHETGQGERLIVAMWHPVEAFEDRILESRKRIGEHFYEAWRAVSPEDAVSVKTRARITGSPELKDARMRVYDLLAATAADAFGEPESLDSEGQFVMTPELEAGPMPVVLVIDIPAGAATGI